MSFYFYLIQIFGVDSIKESFPIEKFATLFKKIFKHSEEKFFKNRKAWRLPYFSGNDLMLSPTHLNDIKYRAIKYIKKEFK